MLVSYVVPFWNACSCGRQREWWTACIESLVRQTHADCEALLVNDGSDDESYDVAHHYERQHPGRVRVIGVPGTAHNGIENALNTGLTIARGSLIARLDADDIAMPDRTAKQVLFLSEHPEIAILGGAMDYIDEHGRPFADCPHRPPVAVSHQQVMAAMAESCPFCHPTVMMRHDVVDFCGGYPSGYPAAEDYALWSKALREFRGANLVDTLTLKRMHSARVSELRKAAQRESAARVRKEWRCG